MTTTARTLQLTPTEAAAWAKVPEGGTFWLARPATCSNTSQPCPWRTCSSSEGTCSPIPPAEFVQACAPCETCGDTREYDGGEPRESIPCPDCRIELVGPCPECNGGGMVAHCGRSDNGSDGPCVLAPHADNFPCYGEGDVASDWLPVSWCDCGICSCGSHQAWTDQGPCGFCHERPRPGTLSLGFAYAVGDPLHFVADPRVMLPGIDLAHYGDPSAQVGKYAVELRRVS